jgi:hypothetical protein
LADIVELALKSAIIPGECSLTNRNFGDFGFSPIAPKTTIPNSNCNCHVTETANDLLPIDFVTGYLTDFRLSFGAWLAVTQSGLGLRRRDAAKGDR